MTFKSSTSEKKYSPPEKNLSPLDLLEKSEIREFLQLLTTNGGSYKLDGEVGLVG